jgi:hypothetical protein
MRERLLTRHFLRRFLDNDLISPNADRHEVLAVVAAGMATLGLFVTVLLSVKYQFEPLQAPGKTSVQALDDRFLYIGASMIVMALVALAQWDAISLDVRDASILGPLPLPRGVVIRAKLASVVLFTMCFAVALNLLPSLLYPVLLVSKLPVDLMGVARLVAAHALVTVAAGAFGFLAVVCSRECLHALVGARWFASVSSLVQACLLIVLATSFLLLPGSSSDVSRSWLPAGGPTPMVVPPLWFLGLHEMIAGDVVDSLRRVPPPADAPRREDLIAAEAQYTAEYRRHRADFAALGEVALLALALTSLAGLAGFAWNARRIPDRAVMRHGSGRWMRSAGRWAGQVLARRPLAAAGFYFTVQTLGRSLPHRVSLGTALAMGLAAATVMLRGVNLRALGEASTLPVAVLAVQTAFVALLVAGVRHAVRVPADLGANWTFQMTWPGDERAYLTGLKRAALAVVALPVLAVLAPLHALVLGPGLALAHFGCGFLLALVLLETSFLGYRHVPFASSYVPAGNAIGRSPIFLVAFLMATYGFAWVERLALASTPGMLIFAACLTLALAGVHALDAWRRRTRGAIEWAELPASVTQRLSLNE